MNVALVRHRARLRGVISYISGVWWWLTCPCVCLCASRWPVTLWPCSRSESPCHVSVSRIGQSFDRSVNRLVNRLVDQSRFLGQPLDQSFCVCRYLYTPAHSRSSTRSGSPLYFPHIYHCITIRCFLFFFPTRPPWKKSKTTPPPTNPSTYACTVSIYGHHCLVSTTFNRE